MSSPGAVEKDGNGSPASENRPDQRYPRSCRLTSRQQFLAVYEKGRRVSSYSFVLFGLPNQLGYCRLGVTVTRKLGGAVVRNRIKRRLREVFRVNRHRLAPALDLVINAKHAIVDVPAADLEREFLNRFKALARGFRP